MSDGGWVSRLMCGKCLGEDGRVSLGGYHGTRRHHEAFLWLDREKHSPIVQLEVMWRVDWWEGVMFPSKEILVHVSVSSSYYFIEKWLHDLEIPTPTWKTRALRQICERNGALSGSVVYFNNLSEINADTDDRGIRTKLIMSAFGYKDRRDGDITSDLHEVCHCLLMLQKTSSPCVTALELFVRWLLR